LAATRFEDLECWSLARELAQAIYGVTAKPPFSRDFSLKDQIRRAAGSVMHNVAEGFDSGSNDEFVRFLRYSQRSCTELQSQLYLAFDCEYIGEEAFGRLYEQSSTVHNKIGALIRYLRRNG
jgi:four helix bundle protein